jgi:hypothetical protein
MSRSLGAVLGETKGIEMNRVFAMIAAMPLLACGAAAEAPPDTTAPASEAESVLQPTYEVTVEPGHVVRWFELGPGRTVALEGREPGQAPVLSRGQTIAEQFAAAQPGQALPEVLKVLVARSEQFQDATPEELAVAVRESGLPIQTGPDEELIEGAPDTHRGGSTPGLSPLVVGQSDTGADDSAFPRSAFIEWSGCEAGDLRRLRRTGSDDSQINEAVAVYTYTASYRNNITYTIKARVDYFWFYGGWQTLLTDEVIREGEGRSWDVQAPATFWVDVKAHIRNADGDGWHTCLWEFL